MNNRTINYKLLVDEFNCENNRVQHGVTFKFKGMGDDVLKCSR